MQSCSSLRLFPLWILGLALATGVTTAFGADADVAEKDRIRLIVREVLREYAAAHRDEAQQPLAAKAGAPE